ncbi:MAG: hypothetical protein ACRDRS_00765 [Pseudonocardiaceae bacterium]
MDRSHLVVLHGSLLVQRDAAARLRALERFIERASPDLLARQRTWLVEQLVAVAPVVPEDAAAAMLLLHQPEPTTVPRTARHAIQLAWVESAKQHQFDSTWETMSCMLAPGDDMLVQSLRDTVREIGLERVSINFRRGAVHRLVERLNQPGSTASLNSALALLELVAEPGSGGSSQHWHCVLGDAARQRGEVSDAAAYYWQAVNGGYQPARPRLAYMLAVEGHGLIGEGQFQRAHELLRTAHSLAGEPEYRLLMSVANLLAGQEAIERIIKDLETVRKDTAAADFWVGIAQLESGDLTEAAASLRRSTNARQSRQTPELAEVAASLLIVAEGGEDGVVALARHLVGRHDAGWTLRCPVCPEQVVIDVAEREPALLRQLLAGYPNGMRLGLRARKRAAHALLDRAVRAPHAGLALDRLRLAERLLEDG